MVHGAAFAPPAELEGAFLDTSREGFRTALDISAYSLIALTRGAAPLMEKRGGGSIVDAHLSRQRSRVPALQRDGRGEGGARIERALSGRRRRAEEHPRQRGVGRADQDGGGARHLRLLDILKVYPERAPLRRNVETAEVAESAAFLLSDAGRGITGEVLMVDAGYHATGM